MNYHYTSLEDKSMRLAYDVAKSFYRLNSWNQKACPVAVIRKNDAVLAIGVSGDGMHQMTAHCDRLDKPGSPYTECKWCVETLHAEQDAIRRLKTDPKGALCYLYGHFHACKACISAMEVLGILDVVLLEGSETLFNRHDPGTIIGKPEQFAI